ncbi:MAG: metalloregulator ArsR/SmtB family transcription factor [Azospirillaceae bacterium]
MTAMDSTSAASALAALGKPRRLDMFRRLVRAGPQGLMVGELQAGMGMPAATFAHHMKALVTAGLVAQERQGRSVVCRSVHPRLEGVIDYLTRECCADVADHCLHDDGEDVALPPLRPQLREVRS